MEDDNDTQDSPYSETSLDDEDRPSSAPTAIDDIHECAVQEVVTPRGSTKRPLGKKRLQMGKTSPMSAVEEQERLLLQKVSIQHYFTFG